jgi:hypothetical protein
VNERSSLRCLTQQFADKARAGRDRPSTADIAEGRQLIARRNELPDSGVTLELKRRPEPNWNSWLDIASFFDAYHEVLAKMDNASSIPDAMRRLRGT